MSIKIIFLFVVLCMVSVIGSAQTVDCYPYKEGKFRVNDKMAGGVVITERSGGYQTESMDALKAIVRFKITWTSDCSFKLTLDKVIRNENKVLFPTNMEINVKIIATTINGYTQETTSSLTRGSYRSNVTRIK